MSDKRTETAEKNDAVNKLDAFWKNNQKIITYVGLAIILVIGGWYAYKQYVVKPKEEKAQAAIFKAEEYYRMDSLNLALNGNQADKGFLYVIKIYGETQTGKLAKYNASIFYRRFKDFDNRIKSDRTKINTREVMLKGYWPYSTPLGYENLKKKQRACFHEYVITDVGKEIKKAFQLNADGRFTKKEINEN